MKNEKPIIFLGEMVKAILDGRKTMTRRVVKSLPRFGVEPCHYSGTGWAATAEKGSCTCRSITNPYGDEGEKLWVRERMRVIEIITSFDNYPDETKIRVRYESDGAESEWIDYPERLKGKPVVGKCLSYGGYREASRINLEITNVRVERLNEISGADAIAEGMPMNLPIGHGDSKACAVTEFEMLWNKINGKKYPWAENCWVWCISFRRAND